MQNPEHITKPGQNAASPIREQRGAALFMLFLLAVSGLTASIVGYRVKSADIERKALLLSTYTALGGSFEGANTPGTSIYRDDLNEQQAVFVLTYEVNSRARTSGLYRFLETTQAPLVQKTVASLHTIEARESARSTEDAWAAFQEPSGSSAIIKNVNPKAARFARQYDRYLARDTEVKLFRYLKDHSATITPQAQKAL